MRVAAGPWRRKWLREKAGIQIQGWLRQLGPIELDCPDLAAVYHNPFFCADPERLPELEAYMDALRKEGDSIGARINLVASGMPVGLGEPIFDRLEADVGKAMLSIGAVKAVEFGAGFGAVAQKGTAHRDEITPRGFRSNSAGGTLGGISSGQDLLVSIGLKPTSSIRLPAATIDKDRADRGDCHHRASRPVCGAARDAHRRGHAGYRTDGPLAAAPRAERRRSIGHTGGAGKHRPD